MATDAQTQVVPTTEVQSVTMTEIMTDVITKNQCGAIRAWKDADD